MAAWTLLILAVNLWVFAYAATAIFVGWLSTVTIERWSLDLRRKIVP